MVVQSPSRKMALVLALKLGSQMRVGRCQVVLWADKLRVARPVKDEGSASGNYCRR